MKTKLAKLALIAVLSTSGATTAFADDAARAEAKQVVDLKNGATLYIFNDGKMAIVHVTPVRPATRFRHSSPPATPSSPSFRLVL